MSCSRSAGPLSASTYPTQESLPTLFISSAFTLRRIYRSYMDSSPLCGEAYSRGMTHGYIGRKSPMDGCFPRFVEAYIRVLSQYRVSYVSLSSDIGYITSYMQREEITSLLIVRGTNIVVFHTFKQHENLCALRFLFIFSLSIVTLCL